MQINSINGSSMKSISFSGIWTENKTFYSDEFNYIDHTDKNYYPFMDETPEMIRKAAGVPYENNYGADWFETGGARVDTSESLTIHKPLSFSESDYNSYKASRFAKPQIKGKLHEMVEKGLKEAGLEHLIWEIGDIGEIVEFKPQSWFKRLINKLIN